MVFSIDAEKLFIRVQHFLMIEALKKLGIEKYTTRKAMHDRSINFHYSKWRKAGSLSSKMTSETNTPTA